MSELEIALEPERVDELHKLLIAQSDQLGYLRMARIVRGETTTDPLKLLWDADALSYYLDGHADTLADTPEELAQAALNWLKRQIVNNWNPAHKSETYKLWAYAPKGERALFTMRLQATQTGEPDPEEAEIPGKVSSGVRPPTEDAWDALSRAYSHLGTSYTRFIDLVTGWQTKLLGMARALQEQTNENLHADRHYLRRQNQELSSRLDQVISEFTSFKVSLLDLGLEQGTGRSRQQNAELNTRLGEKFIGTLGDLGNAFLASKGLSPAMARLLKLLMDDPDLNGVLNDPDLPGLMEDENNRRTLAMLLKQALTAYKMQKQAAPVKDSVTEKGEADEPAK